jgi:N-acetyl-gamma-glutamyl-phosphate reductase
MGITAAVVGASGYAGGELLRILLDHPNIELGPLTAASRAGTPVTAAHPHLLRLSNRRFVATEPASVTGADVVFLALPHGESARFAADLPDTVAVIDLGADHRLADAQVWHEFYGTRYAAHWSYGLPELPGGRQRIRETNRIANPGCYPVSTLVALTPLLAAGLIEPHDIVVVAASGTSGAGSSPKPHLLGTEVMGSLSPYQVAGKHRHIPEIEQELSTVAGTPVAISFTPILAPMPRGILATCTARFTPPANPDAVRQALASAYADEPFVHLLPEGSWPRTADTLGSNLAVVQAALDEHAGRVVVCSAIDNLGKGAAGLAVQNANLVLGLEETAGLPVQGVAP